MWETNGEAISAARNDAPGVHRRWRFWHISVLLVAGLIGIVLGLRWHWKREFRARIAAITAAGYPVTPEELDAWYAWPESGENAADWVIGAGTYRIGLPERESRRLGHVFGWSDRAALHEPLPDDVKDLLVQYVYDNAKALELLHRAAAMRGSRYPIDLSEGAGVYMPFISDVRDGCLLLCFEAVLCGENGDSEGAVAALEAAFRVADTLRLEPVFISQNVRLAMQRSAGAVLERIMSEIELRDVELRRLTEAVSRYRSPEAMRRFMAGHRCMHIDLFKRPASVDPIYFQSTPGPSRGLLELYGGVGLAARDGIVFLDIVEACLVATELPAAERREAVNGIEVRFGERWRRGLLLKNISSIWYGLRFESECVASLRCGLAALAAERFRLGTGRWPEALDELVPDYLEGVPEDPFDGAALRYKRLVQGFVVYSVGEDGRDDGGWEEPPRDRQTAGQTYDITFTVER